MLSRYLWLKSTWCVFFIIIGSSNFLSTYFSVGSSIIVFGDVKVEFRTIESCFNYSSGSNLKSDCSFAPSDIALSTYSLAVKWESIWGNWLIWIFLALVRFLSIRSICAELLNIIVGSLNFLSTYFFEAGSRMLIGSGIFWILFWFFQSISSSILLSI